MADNIVNFFNEDEERKIIQSIEKAELNTSGEIRVHLENYCPRNLMNRAALIFEKLEMHKTKERNGVLIYIAVRDKKFAIIGDAGINHFVEDDFWDDISLKLGEKFKSGDFVGGLSEAIHEIGQRLQKYFEYQSDDVNELPNEISYEE